MCSMIALFTICIYSGTQYRDILDEITRIEKWQTEKEKPLTWNLIQQNVHRLGCVRNATDYKTNETVFVCGKQHNWRDQFSFVFYEFDWDGLNGCVYFPFHENSFCNGYFDFTPLHSKYLLKSSNSRYFLFTCNNTSSQPLSDDIGILDIINLDRQFTALQETSNDFGKELLLADEINCYEYSKLPSAILIMNIFLTGSMGLLALLASFLSYRIISIMPTRKFIDVINSRRKINPI